MVKCPITAYPYVNGTSRPALSSTDREWIGNAIEVLLTSAKDAPLLTPEDRFHLINLKQRIVTPAKGRPHPASMENLSAMHYATKG